MEMSSMLDQLQMAIRRYEQITPNAGGDMTLSQADQLSEWLERQVGRITASLLSRPEFRCRVRWSIERLTGEINCSEREAVLAVDESLVRCAGALCSVAQTDAISRQLLRLGPYQNEVDEGDPSALDAVPENSSLPPTPLGFRGVDFVASRPWRDLASAWDYFHPTSQLNLTEPDEMQWAHFLPYVNRQLRVPGDFITRCMEIRIEHWRDKLQRFFIRCHTARRNANVDLGTQWSELDNVRSELNTRIDELHRLSLLGQEARVRDSCVALLQIHAGFHRDTNLSWLGPVAEMVTGVSDIPHRVARQQQWDVPERAVAALIDIADIVRHQHPEDLIKEMKATKRLVLIEEQRQGFLDGVPIEANGQTVNWHGRDNLMWELLWTLADRARIRRSVDCYCLSNPKALEAQDPPSLQAVKDRRSDLKKLIVAELNELIVDAGRGTYRLEVDRDDICLLGWFNDERLDVLPPTVPRHSHA
jgi:hypothetical protein